MEILLTNDDGYQSPGLHALADGLEEIAEVTVVAPKEDQSGCGRLVSEEVSVEEIPLGYAVDGTPVDCVVVGLDGLGLAPDLVIAGCNVGGNLGRYVLGRSGTVSAAVEATFFGLPAIATSLYVPETDWPFDSEVDDFTEAVRATRYLASTIDELNDRHPGGYFNVNVPLPGPEPAPLSLTRPTDHYDMRAETNGSRAAIVDDVWDRMAKSEITDPVDTDRGAVRRGHVSVSPLRVPDGLVEAEAFDAILTEYEFGLAGTDVVGVH